MGKNEVKDFEVVVHAVDGMHTIGTDLTNDEALAVAKDWLGDTFNEVVPDMVFVSKFGERLTIRNKQ